jgi:hypothetical protein
MSISLSERSESNPVSKDQSTPHQISRLASKLLPLIARKKATQKYAARAGASFFYELGKGWETKVLEQDNDILKVYTSREMEQAFKDPRTKTILIPKDAAITKTVALRICSRNGLSKTIFYEAVDHE